MPLPGSPKLMAAAKLLVSLGFLAWCLSEVPIGQLAPMLGQAQAWTLLTLVPAIIFEALAGAWRFKLLLDTVHVLPVRTHVAQYFIAGYFNIALPSSMGGDAARVLMLTRSGASLADATVSVLIDRIIGVYSLVLIAVLAVTVSDLPTPLAHLVYGIAVCMALGAAVTIVGYRYFLGSVFANGARWQWLNAVLRTLDRIRDSPLAVAHSAAISVLFQLLTIGFTWLVALGFDIRVDPLEVFALVPLTWIATMVPISVGGLGVREVSFTYLFGLVGVPAAEALLLSLGTYAVFVLIALIGAALMALLPSTKQHS